MMPRDYDDKMDEARRENETKEERRLRRKKEMKRILEYEAAHKEEIQTYGMIVTERRPVRKNLVEQKEAELFQLAAKARQGRYSNEQIGQLFREIFKDF